MPILTMTGRTRDGKCHICGLPVRTAEWKTINGKHWAPVAHRAPCGAHCMGGGVESEEMDVHIKHFGPCPRCGMVGSEVAEIVTRADGGERLVFHRYTPDYRPELGYRIDHEYYTNNAWVVDARFSGESKSLAATKEIATLYYHWFKDLFAKRVSDDAHG